MRLLFIGDVVGKEGCEFLASKLSRIKSDYNIDFTVINGETQRLKRNYEIFRELSDQYRR